MTEPVKDKEHSPKYKKPTLRDIAKLAGVSVSTVSEILNNTSRNYCSEAVKERVRTVMRELNYRPNIGYKIMRSQQTRIVGIICASGHLQQEEHILELLMALTRSLEASQYTVYLAAMTKESSANIDHIEKLCQYGSSSFIFIGPPAGRETIYPMLAQRGIHVIGYNAECAKDVHHNRNKAISELAAHLTDQGCRRLQILSFEAPIILDAPLPAGVGREDTLIPREAWNETEDFRDFCFQQGEQWVRELLDKNIAFDGLIFYSDYFALGGCAELFRHNIIPGRSIHVTGLNDSFAVRCAPYPISSAHLDIPHVSRLLIDHLTDKEPFSITLNMDISRR